MRTHTKIFKRSILSLVSFLALSLAVPPVGHCDEDADPGSQTKKTTIYLVCSDQSWYPFVYSDPDVGGIHIDMVTKALENAGYSVKIEAMPIARCVKMAEHNMVDGIISVAYNKNYARFLEYPPGSAEQGESKWRIMQVDDVVVTLAEDPYEFDGNLNSLPQPVHVFKAEPIIDELKDLRIEIDDADTNWINY